MAHGDAMQDDLYGRRKSALFAGLHGTVVEIGPGTGINLPYFPTGIRYVGVEPNPHMHPFLRKKAEALGLAVELHTATLEQLALEDASVDAVVSTLVLCSVPDEAATLGEIRRVLRPGGRFYFIEHVAAPPGTALRRMQQIVKPAWRLVADGCRPDRETGRLLEAAGFAEIHCEAFDLDQPFSLVKPHIAGMAVKANASGSRGGERDEEGVDE